MPPRQTLAPPAAPRKPRGAEARRARMARLYAGNEFESARVLHRRMQARLARRYQRQLAEINVPFEARAPANADPAPTATR